ncbi:MAG: hypothetical protein J0I16_20040 [Rhizobiales bacterium]|nr:hypothetical protein [Hyphomicrobiales bacterium]
MIRPWLVLMGAFIAGVTGSCAPRAAWACSDTTSCVVDGGSYLVRPPAHWDGKSVLPAVFYFHGYGDSAASTIADIYMKPPLDKAGILLVAMDGEDHSWSFPGKISGHRDDFAYVAAVVADVKKRFPVDPTRTLAAGFSVGGSMVWYVACRLGPLFAGYAPMSGAYWEPMPSDCPGGPVMLRHIHGLADKTVPIVGRSLRNGLYKQGDANESFRRLLARNGCAAVPEHVSVRGALTCRSWSAAACTSGKAAEFCLHDGGHTIEAQWIVDSLDWLKGQTAATAAVQR